MSIRAMEEEISNQAQNLPRFASQLRKTHVPKLKPSKLIFSGSGDSYAAAVFAQELSEGKAIAFDPYELLTNIKRIRGKSLVIISVSGRTRTNIELARKSKGIATNTLAITANPESPLAGECDETLQLKYRTTGILTSGTISFTTSLLACAFLLESMPRTVQVKTALAEICYLATNLKQDPEGSFLFMGSGVNYALSLYGAAKINEVLGTTAEAIYPEQLGHAKLFTIDKKRDGFQSSILAIPEGYVVNRSLKIAIHMQQLALALAKERRMTECAFLADKKRLNLSNRLIY